MTGSRRAVFLDRDGVLNGLCFDSVSGSWESPYGADAVFLEPGVPSAISRLRKLGFLLVVVSNQPAAAKGRVDRARLDQVHARVIRLLESEGAWIDDFRYCYHHPLGVVPSLTGECPCRKPKPGMILAAAADHGIDLAASWLVGDTDSDVEAGISAGCRTAVVENPGSRHKRKNPDRADRRAPSLLHIASGCESRLS